MVKVREKSTPFFRTHNNSFNAVAVDAARYRLPCPTLPGYQKSQRTSMHPLAGKNQDESRSHPLITEYRPQLTHGSRKFALNVHYTLDVLVR